MTAVLDVTSKFRAGEMLRRRNSEPDMEKKDPVLIYFTRGELKEIRARIAREEIGFQAGCTRHVKRRSRNYREQRSEKQDGSRLYLYRLG